MINWFFDLYVFCINDYFLHNFLDLYHLGYFLLNWDHYLPFCWDFNNLLFDCWDFHEFLDDTVHDFHHLHWFVDYLLDLDILGNLHDLFHVFLDGNHLRHLDYSLDHFLHYLFNLNDLGNHSEDFQNIIDIYDSHDLLVDHSYYSFIELEDCSSFCLDLFQFFQESFEEHS